MGSQSQAITQTEETFREVFRKGVYDVIIAHLPGLETSANDACRFAMMAHRQGYHVVLELDPTDASHKLTLTRVNQS